MAQDPIFTGATQIAPAPTDAPVSIETPTGIQSLADLIDSSSSNSNVFVNGYCLENDHENSK
jgi:hypothetical protein